MLACVSGFVFEAVLRLSRWTAPASIHSPNVRVAGAGESAGIESMAQSLDLPCNEIRLLGVHAGPGVTHVSHRCAG